MTDVLVWFVDEAVMDPWYRFRSVISKHELYPAAAAICATEAEADAGLSRFMFMYTTVELGLQIVAYTRVYEGPVMDVVVARMRVDDVTAIAVDVVAVVKVVALDGLALATCGSWRSAMSMAANASAQKTAIYSPLFVMWVVIVMCVNYGLKSESNNSQALARNELELR